MTITPKRICKADIFFRRVNGKARSSELSVNTPVDALYACLNDRAKVDLHYIQKLLPSLSENNILRALQSAPVKIKKGTEWVTETQSLIFFDPEKQAWVMRDEYLSGDTRKKFEFLQFCKEETPESYAKLGLQINFDALSQCLPKYLLPPNTIDPDIRIEAAHRMGGENECDVEGKAYINLRLGSPILTEEDIQAFVAYLLDWDNPSVIEVAYCAPFGAWSVFSTDYSIKEPAKKSEYALSYECTTREGTFSASEDLFWVVTKALNDAIPRIEHRDENDRLLNEATQLCSQAAISAIERVKDAFKEWIWTDLERSCRITAEYNRVFPRLIRRKYDGSHLKLPGSNPKIQLNPWQLNGVWRAVLSGTLLLAWEVGSGKSFTMIAAAMEMKRLGIARKPMLLCLNGTEGQLAADFLKLYPRARLLIADEKSFAKENRRKLIAQIRSCDWDCIILAHSQFLTIPVTHETREAYIQAELDTLNEYLEEVGDEYILRRMVEDQIETLNQRLKKNEALEIAVRASSEGDKETIEDLINEGLIEITPGGRFKTTKNSSKADDREAKRISKTISEAMDNYRKDPLIPWESLGIDWVALDEAHIVKNLHRSTKMRNVAGLSTASSQQSMDALLKFHHTLSKGGRIVFSTGTPCSNSMSEWWVMQRFLGYDRLKSTLGLDHFDNWAHQFGEIRTEIEITHTGGMKPKTRFGRFCNLFVLMDMISEFTDFVRADNVGLKRPKPNFATVTADIGPDQIDFLDEILQRNEALNRRKPCAYYNKKGKLVFDNALTMTNLGSLNALDPRLVVPDARNFRNSKLNVAVHNIWSIWKATTVGKLTQLVFSDLGVPSEDESLFNAYYYIRDALIALGVPPHEIAIIHDYKRSQLKNLFQKIRDGVVRILIGSTDKCGTGVNVQDRCIAGHDISIPWTPAKLDQRRGRIYRQGNLLSEIFLFTYVTQGRNGQPGFDAFKVQTVECKHNFITQFMSGEVASNDYEESDDEGAMSYNLTKALASGDPRIIEFAKVGDRAKKMEIEVNALATKVARDGSNLRDLPNRILKLNARRDALLQDVATRDKHKALLSGAMVNCKIHGKLFAGVQDAGEAIVARIKQVEKERFAVNGLKIGEFAGFDLRIGYFPGDNRGVRTMELVGHTYTFPDTGFTHYHSYKFDVRYTPETIIDIMRKALIEDSDNPEARLATIEADLANAVRERSILPTRLESMKEELIKLQEKLKALRDRETELKTQLAVSQTSSSGGQEEQQFDRKVKDPKLPIGDFTLLEGSKPAKYQPPEPEVIEYLKSLPEPSSKDVDGNPVTWMPKIRELTKQFLSRLQEQGQTKVLDLPVTRQPTTLTAVQGGGRRKSRKISKGQLTTFELFA